MGIARRLSALMKQSSVEREIDEELRSHLEMAAEENRQRGMTKEDARRKAMRDFGGVTQVRERYRMREGLPWIENLRRDMGYALRQMRKSPGFAAVVALGPRVTPRTPAWRNCPRWLTPITTALVSSCPTRSPDTVTVEVSALRSACLNCTLASDAPFDLAVSAYGAVSALSRLLASSEAISAPVGIAIVTPGRTRRSTVNPQGRSPRSRNASITLPTFFLDTLPVGSNRFLSWRKP